MIKILHFTADWCAPCKRLKPIVEDYIIKNPGIEYETVDVDIKYAIAQEYGVQTIPTIIILKDGRVANRHMGIISYPDLDKLINKPL